MTQPNEGSAGFGFAAGRRAPTHRTRLYAASQGPFDGFTRADRAELSALVVVVHTEPKTLVAVFVVRYRALSTDAKRNRYHARANRNLDDAAVRHQRLGGWGQQRGQLGGDVTEETRGVSDFFDICRRDLALIVVRQRGVAQSHSAKEVHVGEWDSCFGANGSEPTVDRLHYGDKRVVQGEAVPPLLRRQRGFDLIGRRHSTVYRTHFAGAT